jgi:hypothetical protein
MMSGMALNIPATLCLFAGLPTMPDRRAREIPATRAETSQTFSRRKSSTFPVWGLMSR